MRLVVIGAGISGLAAARTAAATAEAAGRSLEVVVLEKSAEVGGKARTVSEGDWLVEAGPGSYLDNEPTFRALVEEAGFADRQIAADDAASRRYLARGGALREVPMHPLRFAVSGHLGPLGMLRILAEPFVPAGDHDADGPDESIHGFAARRLGRQVADRLVAPMVLGIYAGDAARLSLPAAMPKLAALEREHGSLIRGMFARRRAAPDRALSAGPSGKLSSFRDGMQSLPRALATDPRITVRCGAEVTALRKGEDGCGYRIDLGDDGGSLAADAVVLAGEAWAMAALLESLAPRSAAALEGIEMPAVTVAALGYGPEAAAAVPPGFGVLVPRDEGIRILGCVWDSYVFPGRAPGDHLLVRAMLGGTVDPAAGRLGAEDALELARREVAELLGVREEPVFTRVSRWPRAIPQYDLEHSARKRTVADELATLPGLFLAGNALEGVSFARSGATGVRMGRAAAEFAVTRARGAGVDREAVLAGTGGTDG